MAHHSPQKSCFTDACKAINMVTRKLIIDGVSWAPGTETRDSRFRLRLQQRGEKMTTANPDAAKKLLVRSGFPERPPPTQG
jgi:hypothetical protein